MTHHYLKTWDANREELEKLMDRISALTEAVTKLTANETVDPAEELRRRNMERHVPK